LRAVTPDTALRLSRYFGFSPDYWLQRQWRDDLELAKRRDWARIEREVKPCEAA
jgi:plasmid maintenance system antidote protein VapI